MSFSVAGMIGAAAASKGMELGNELIPALFSNYLGRKNEKKSLKRQYQYAQLYALNSPSWYVQGLRNANLNPILAATDGAFSSPTVPSSSYNSPSSGGGSSIDLLGAYINAQAVESQKALQGSQESLNYVRAINELKNMGFNGSAGVAARLFSELVGPDVLKGKGAKQAFEKFWNDINPPNSTTGTTSLSSPDGPTTSSHETKFRHHPSDTKSVYEPVLDYLSPSERKSFDILVDRYGFDDAASIFSKVLDRASHHKRTNDAFRRIHSRGHRVSPIYSR